MTLVFVAGVADFSDNPHQCSPTTCTTSILSFFAFTIMSGRAGTGWPMCWRSFAATSFCASWRKPAMRICLWNRWATLSRAALFGVIIGGRLGYVFFYKPEMLREPLSILRVWEGGMSSHGGMIGLLLFTFYFARRHKISWTNLGDNLVVTAPLGLFFGRCANFINGELYGRITNVPWAMQFPKELLDHPAEADRAIATSTQIDPSLTTPEAIIAALNRQPEIAAALRSILTPRHPRSSTKHFSRDRFVRDLLAGAHADAPAERSDDRTVLYLLRGLSDRDRIFP